MRSFVNEIIRSVFPDELMGVQLFSHTREYHSRPFTANSDLCPRGTVEGVVIVEG